MAGIDRREFLKNAGRIVGGVAATGALSSCASQQQTPQVIAPCEPNYCGPKKRLAVVGTGKRCLKMWGPRAERLNGDYIEYVGICDSNYKRAIQMSEWFEKPVPTYTNFDTMIAETRPETVIVTTTDSTHVDYVVRAMELGCDVICEKPYGTTAEGCQAMHDAEKKSGRDVIVTFNVRYMPATTKIKELILAGEIGDIYSVSYGEYLGLRHGGSYFRRWHGLIKSSGSLLVHKACHHFDEINWLLDADPVEVVAYGDLNKYGHNGSFRSGFCRECPHMLKCKFYWDINTSEWQKKLYADCQFVDGYSTDACLYRNEIDTYDTNTVMIKYDNGAKVSYTLNATVPYEGQNIIIDGSKGRIELLNGYGGQAGARIRLFRNFKDMVAIDPGELAGAHEHGHGGADDVIRNDIFNPNANDQLGRLAGSRAGIMSALIGIAGYTSIESDRPVKIKDLINLG